MDSDVKAKIIVFPELHEDDHKFELDIEWDKFYYVVYYCSRQFFVEPARGIVTCNDPHDPRKPLPSQLC